MSVSPRPRHTNLRDFGAFQIDVLDTQETPALGKAKVPTRGTPTMDDDLRPSMVGVPLVGTLTCPNPLAAQNQHLKRWLPLALRICLTLILFALLLRSVSWSTFFAALTQVNFGLVLVGLTVGAFGIVISSYQWRSLLQAEHIYADLATLINLYIVGVAFSHLLPTGMGGDAVKAIHVGRESGNNAGSASAVIMSRLTGFFGMFLLALPALVIWHASFSTNLILEFLLLSLIVVGIICGTIFSVTLFPRLLQRKWSKLGRQLQRWQHLLASVQRIGTALQEALRRPRFLGVATLFGIEFWVVACLNYYAYASALGLQTPLYFYLVAIPFVSLVAFLPISINGFGLREGAFVYIFSTMHVPVATALLLALLMDVQMLFFGAIGAGLYLKHPILRRGLP